MGINCWYCCSSYFLLDGYYNVEHYFQTATLLVGGRFGWSLWEIQERRMRTHLKCALKTAASSSTLGLFISDAFLAVAGFLFWE